MSQAITLEWLEEREACSPAREEFGRRWPDGQCTIGQSVDALAEIDGSGWAFWLLRQCLTDRAPRVAVEVAYRAATSVPQGAAGQHALDLVRRWLDGAPVTPDELYGAREAAWVAYAGAAACAAAASAADATAYAVATAYADATAAVASSAADATAAAAYAAAYDAADAAKWAIWRQAFAALEEHT